MVDGRIGHNGQNVVKHVDMEPNQGLEHVLIQLQNMGVLIVRKKILKFVHVW